MGTCFLCLLLLINFPSQFIYIWLNFWLFLKEWVWLTETALNPCPTPKCSAEWGRAKNFASSKCEAKSKTQWENLLYILNTEGWNKEVSEKMYENLKIYLSCFWAWEIAVWYSECMHTPYIYAVIIDKYGELLNRKYNKI